MSKSNDTLAILLITLGFVFLLSNFNLLPWSVFAALWRLWPILLIILGYRLLSHK